MALKMFAAICIGSSETELKIFEMNGRKAMREIEWISTRLNLGLDAYRSGKIEMDNVEELCLVLTDFKQVMQTYKVDDYRVCATSAFRVSRNVLLMKDYIEKRTGLKIDVLSNSEQRFLDYEAIASVTSEFATIIQNPAAIVDIGGNSMQISLFDKDKLITTQNIHIGSVSTREKLAAIQKNDAHFESLVSELLNHEMEGFAKLYQKDRKIKNLIVIGGNQRDLLNHYLSGEKQIPSVTVKQFLSVYEEIKGLRADEAARKFNIMQEDAGIVMASAIYCKVLMDQFNTETLWLPDYNLCDGIAYDYAMRKHIILNTHDFSEDIIAAARVISKRYKCNQAHIKNLEQIGLAVFDKLKKSHSLTDRERLILQISIILHNCGKFISLEDVADCAYNIIMATEIIGLSHIEREMIAYIVKYNTTTFETYDILAGNTDLTVDNYLTIAKLTAILRIINSMDRTHQQKCKNVQITLKDGELKFVVDSQSDLTLEKKTFNEKTDFFEEVFHVHTVLKQKKKL